MCYVNKILLYNVINNFYNIINNNLLLMLYGKLLQNLIKIFDALIVRMISSFLFIKYYKQEQMMFTSIESFKWHFQLYN